MLTFLLDELDNKSWHINSSVVSLDYDSSANIVFGINYEKKISAASDGNNGIWMLCNITRGTCSVGNIASKLMSMSRYDEIIALSKEASIDPKGFIQIGSKIISQNIKRIYPGAKAENGVICYLQITRLVCEKPELKEDLRKLFHTKEGFDKFNEYFPVDIETMTKYSDNGMTTDGLGIFGCFIVVFDPPISDAVIYTKFMSRFFKVSKGKYASEFITELHKSLQEKDQNVKHRNMNLWGRYVQRVGTSYKNIHDALVGYQKVKIRQ